MSPFKPIIGIAGAMLVAAAATWGLIPEQSEARPDDAPVAIPAFVPESAPAPSTPPVVQVVHRPRTDCAGGQCAVARKQVAASRGFRSHDGIFARAKERRQARRESRRESRGGRGFCGLFGRR